MSERKKVLIVGKDPQLNYVAEGFFQLGEFETITCRKKKEARKIQKTEGDNIEQVFYPKKHKKKKFPY